LCVRQSHNLGGDAERRVGGEGAEGGCQTVGTAPEGGSDRVQVPLIPGRGPYEAVLEKSRQ